MKKALMITMVCCACILAQESEPESQSIPLQSEVGTEQQLLDSERRVLEAEKRALDAERRALDAEKNAGTMAAAIPKHESAGGGSITHIDAEVGYRGVFFDDYIYFDDVEFNGVSFGVGVSHFFTKIEGFGYLGCAAGVSFTTVSATLDKSMDLKLKYSMSGMSVVPKVRIGDDKLYADVGFEISIPFFSQMKMTASGYTPETESLDTDIDFGIGLSGRCDIITASIARSFSSEVTVLGIGLILPISTEIEFIPSFVYWFEDNASELAVVAGFRYLF